MKEKKRWNKKTTEKQRKMFFLGASFFVRKKWREKGSTGNFTKSLYKKRLFHTQMISKNQRTEIKRKKGRKRKNEDVTLTILLKKPKHENIIFSKKGEWKRKPKRRVKKKKNEKPFFKTQKKTWKINFKKDVHQKKRKQTKPSILETEGNRKMEFRRRIQRYKKLSRKYWIQKTKRQSKNKKKAKFKREEKGERTEKNTERQQIEHVDRGWRKEEMKR